MKPRTYTPDRVEVTDDGRTRTRITMKRVCNGCGEYIGDVTEAEMDCAITGQSLPDVRNECKHCAPVVEAEQAGCRIWQLTPTSFPRVMDQIDRLRPWVFTKGYTRAVGPRQRLATVGLRVGQRPDHVVAFWGDWIIRHPDGTFTVHKAPDAIRCAYCGEADGPFVAGLCETCATAVIS